MSLQVRPGEKVSMVSKLETKTVTIKEVFLSGRITIKEYRYKFNPDGWQRFRRELETAQSIRKLFKMESEL